MDPEFRAFEFPEPPPMTGGLEPRWRAVAAAVAERETILGGRVERTRPGVWFDVAAGPAAGGDVPDNVWRPTSAPSCNDWASGLATRGTWFGFAGRSRLLA